GALVGELGRLEQRVARLLPVVVVAFQRLLAHAAPGRASREQRVGELRVHVGELEVQVAGRDDLGTGVVTDHPHALAGVGDRRPRHRDQRDEQDDRGRRQRPDAGRDGAGEQPAEAGRRSGGRRPPQGGGAPPRGRGGSGGRVGTPRPVSLVNGRHVASPRMSVMVVRAPTWIRSPSRTGTSTLNGIGSIDPFRQVRLVEPGSTSVQEPSGLASRTAWVWETPGSSGGSRRSISGGDGRPAPRRPIRTCGPTSGMRRSGAYGGKVSRSESGPPSATTLSKYSRSAVTTAVSAAP